MIRRIIHLFTIKGFLTSEAIVKISNRKALVSFHILSIREDTAKLDQLCNVLGQTISKYLLMPTHVCVHWIKTPVLTPQLLTQFLFNSLRVQSGKIPSVRAIAALGNLINNSDHFNRGVTHQKCVSLLRKSFSDVKPAQTKVKYWDAILKSKSMDWSTPANRMLTKQMMTTIEKGTAVPKNYSYLEFLVLIFMCSPCYFSLVNLVFNANKLAIMQRKYRELKNFNIQATGRINSTNKKGLWKYQKGNLKRQYFNSNVLSGSAYIIGDLGKTNLKVTMK